MHNKCLLVGPISNYIILNNILPGQPYIFNYMVIGKIKLAYVMSRHTAALY